MARVFQRLLKASKTQKAGLKVLGWDRRLRRLEESLFEANALKVREINQVCGEESREPTDWESDFLGAAEDFRKHLKEVLEVKSDE